MEITEVLKKRDALQVDILNAIAPLVENFCRDVPVVLRAIEIDLVDLGTHGRPGERILGPVLVRLDL